MAWLQTIVLVVVLMAVGLYLVLGVAIIVTALVERRPLKFLALADPDDPEQQKPGAVESGPGPPELSASHSNPYTSPGTLSYAEPRIRSASRLGFVPSRLFKHTGGGIYKTYGVLMVSHSRQILALIRWGTTAKIRNEVTVLYSALEDGRYLVTSDRTTGSRVPGLEDDLVYLAADFDQLVRRHEMRMGTSGRMSRQLSAENPLAEYEAVLERRARFLVAEGEAYWIDSAQTAVRSTLKGALRWYARSFSTSHVDRSLSAGVRSNA